MIDCNSDVTGLIYYLKVCKEQTDHPLQPDAEITSSHNLPLQLELHTTFKILSMSSFMWEIEESERVFRCRAGQLLFCYIPQIWLLPLLRMCRVTAFVQPVIPALLSSAAKSVILTVSAEGSALNCGSLSSFDEASWLSHLFFSVASSHSLHHRL